MDGNKNKAVKAKRSLIAFQLLAFGSFAAMNYYNVYLRSIGFTSQMIGTWGAIASIVSAVTLPFFGRASDRMGSPKILYLISMAAYMAILLSLPLAGENIAATTVPLWALMLCYSIVSQPTHTLQDAWFIGISNRNGIPYASTRMWGSFGFAVVSIFNGFITKQLGTAAAFYVVPFLILPLLFLGMRFKEPEQPGKTVAGGEAPTIKKKGVFSLLKNKKLLAAFLMTIVFACYTAFTTPFYAFILENAGVPADRFGLISGYGAFVQVGCMAFVTRFCKKIKPEVILVAGGLLGVVENLLYGVADGLPLMFVAGTFWGIVQSLYVSVLPTYILSLVPRDYAATATSLNGTVVMLLTIAGNYIGGQAIAATGIVRYTFGISVFRFALTAAFALVLLLQHKKSKMSTS